MYIISVDAFLELANPSIERLLRLHEMKENILNTEKEDCFPEWGVTRILKLQSMYKEKISEYYFKLLSEEPIFLDNDAVALNAIGFFTTTMLSEIDYY